MLEKIPTSSPKSEALLWRRRPEAEEENGERSVRSLVEMRINLHNVYCVNKILKPGNCRVVI